MKKISLLIVVSLFSTSNLAAQNFEDCKKITNSKKRLDCFDIQQKLNEILAENEKSKIDAEKIKAEAEAEKKKTQEALELKTAEFLSSANIALKSAKKLDSRISVGISYREYYEPLADVKFEVESFAFGVDGGKNKKFSKSLLKALNHYTMAGEIWKLKISYINKGNGSMPLNQNLLEDYPNADSYSYNCSNRKCISFDKMLSIIWQAADEELNNAESALNNPT